MIIKYLKEKKSFSQWWSDFLWRHEWLFVLTWFGSIIGAVFICFLLAMSFSLVDEKPEDVKKAYLYEVVITKNNGLKTTIYVESNDTVKVHDNRLFDKVRISVKGKNMYGITINDDINIENVKSYTVKYKKY